MRHLALLGRRGDDLVTDQQDRLRPVRSGTGLEGQDLDPATVPLLHDHLQQHDRSMAVRVAVHPFDRLQGVSGEQPDRVGRAVATQRRRRKDDRIAIRTVVVNRRTQGGIDFTGFQQFDQTTGNRGLQLHIVQALEPRDDGLGVEELDDSEPQERARSRRHGVVVHFHHAHSIGRAGATQPTCSPTKRGVVEPRKRRVKGGSAKLAVPRIPCSLPGFEDSPRRGKVIGQIASVTITFCRGRPWFR